MSVPRWALIAGSLLVAVVGATFGATSKIIRAEERVNTIDIRLCRIERALKIPEWPTCFR